MMSQTMESSPAAVSTKKFSADGTITEEDGAILKTAADDNPPSGPPPTPAKGDEPETRFPFPLANQVLLGSLPPNLVVGYLSKKMLLLRQKMH